VAAAPHYKRVLIKLSGEVMGGAAGVGVDAQACTELATSLKRLQDAGVEVGVVIGGGNIFRGAKAIGMQRVPADHAGMLATIVNGIILQQTLHNLKARCHVMSALGATEVVEAYEWRRALHYLHEGNLVIFAGGTGNPHFTTDSCAALRAAEIEAEVLLKATKVDGVYDKDPVSHPDARRLPKLTYQEALEQELEVMDATAFALCRENRIPIKVFNFRSLWEGATNPEFGSLIHGD
jgi:uridylate kinase